MKYKSLILTVCTFLFGACSPQNKVASDNEYLNFDSEKTQMVSKQAEARKTSSSSGLKKDELPNGDADKIEMIAQDAKPFIPDAPKVPGTRVASVSVPAKVVALTFDDGPHGSLTPKILDILSRYDAKGTFFMVGSNVQLYPGIVRRMVSEGHEVANHTWNHPNFNKSSRVAIASQISRTNDAIVKACGASPRLIRPPYGACSTALSSWIKQEYGLTTVMWSVDTEDWRKRGVASITSKAVNSARPGSIILVHDIHSMTASSIEGIVKGLKNRGFQLVTVSELIRMGRQYSEQPAEGGDVQLTSAGVADGGVQQEGQ